MARTTATSMRKFGDYPYSRDTFFARVTKEQKDRLVYVGAMVVLDNKKVHRVLRDPKTGEFFAGEMP